MVSRHANAMLPEVYSIGVPSRFHRPPVTAALFRNAHINKNSMARETLLEEKRGL